MIPVILSGGSGTRLWPVSRKTHPKQFWPLAAKGSMLQETCQRLAGSVADSQPIVVCNLEHRFFVAHQMTEMGLDKASIILEPDGRNTAPAIAVAAFHALSGGNDPLLLVLPADHVIENKALFHKSLESAQRLAEAGWLVSFGIVPHAAETGYGYIQSGELLADVAGAARIARFVEKPDKVTAETYLASGQYLWNSGMFVLRASAYLKELDKHAPAIHASAAAAYTKAKRDMDFIRLDTEAFAACPNDSIDYAVMERTDRGAILPLDVGWNDVGSWSALWDIGAKDAAGNVVRGDVALLDCRNNYLESHGGRLIAVLGIEDLVVVDTKDVTLVAHRDAVQKIKDLVNHLSTSQRREINIHAKVHRPWGCFEGVDSSDRFQVKRITVNPGAELSLQKHHHRAEHWIVVRGTAEVTRGKETFLLSENESTYIPIGETHRLKNPGRIPLELIEVQSGSYLGEDDIVRLSDNYGRQEC